MKRNIKWIFIGMIISTIINLGIGHAEELFSLSKSDYPIIVDGKQLESDLPVLNYNGNTYLPLRKVAEATGVKIEWFEELKRIGITSNVKIKKVYVTATPTPTPSITPIPISQDTNYYKKSLMSDGSHIETILNKVDNTGLGVYTNPKSNEKYIGYFTVNNGTWERNGFGMVLVDGDIHCGEFKNNNLINGIIKSKTEKNNKYISEILDNELGINIYDVSNTNGDGSCIANLVNSKGNGYSYINTPNLGCQVVKFENGNIVSRLNFDKQSELIKSSENNYNSPKTTTNNQEYNLILYQNEFKILTDKYNLDCLEAKNKSDKIYSNIFGEETAKTGGRSNSWAVTLATKAQKEYYDSYIKKINEKYNENIKILKTKYGIK